MMLAACSTVAPAPQVTTRTKIELLTPPVSLMQLCTAATVRRTAQVRDIVENGAAWRSAYTRCAVRMECLVWWWQTAAKVPVTAECAKAER
jgi:hypothetical protein